MTQPAVSSTLSRVRLAIAGVAVIAVTELAG